MYASASEAGSIPSSSRIGPMSHSVPATSISICSEVARSGGGRCRRTTVCALASPTGACSFGRGRSLDDDPLRHERFKLHLLVDVKNEVVLSYEVTDTKAGDGATLPVLLEQAQTNLPPHRIKLSLIHI